ncbi:MAG: sulfotransferase [Deltaproteobacteria bacterium]|nr:sulfotransferase [Deltaproteobacteria bacterium]
MTVPNFMIIGAAKSGTTSLYYYLNQHPQIYFSPIKETNFFVSENSLVNFKGPGDEQLTNILSVTDFETYQSLFNWVNGETAIGEASIAYLYDEKAAYNIHRRIPNIKIIAILRNPVERAFQGYTRMRMLNREKCKVFSEALELEESRINENWEPIWHYKQLGFYGKQLKRYFDVFPRENIKIYQYESLMNNEVALINDMFDFLNVDKCFKPDVSQRYNYSGIPKYKSVQNVLKSNNILSKCIRSTIPQRIFSHIERKNLMRPQIPVDVKIQLQKEYRDDICLLQDLINCDLTHWLNY